MQTDHYVWTLTSTGTAAGYDLRGLAGRVTFYVETHAGSTATVQFRTARSTTGSTVTGILGSTSGYGLSTGEIRTFQFSGPLGIVAPRIVGLTASTGSITVELRGEGSW